MVSLHDSFYEGYVSYGMELGRVEGYSKGTIDAVANDATSIATNLNMTLDQAIEALNVPSDIRDEVRQKAEQLLKERD